MASLVLGAVGSAFGASFGTFSLFGFTLSGAQIGGAVGATLGMAIDGALMPSIKRSGTRLSDISIQSSTEGKSIPRLYGRVRVAGQIIWASRFKETSSTSGSKGLGARSVETTGYAYSVSFAVGLCAGPITRIGRIWADGNLIDPTDYTIRVYPGSETQTPDSVIEEIEGQGNSPAYRGLCYVVFEDMPLAEFGNRIPQLQFEVMRVLSLDDSEALENRLMAVALIPGAGEFVYASGIVTEHNGLGTSKTLNAYNASGNSDWSASLDELQALAPKLRSVSLVVGWFGSDLRCGSCTVQPGIEQVVRHTYPESWSVDGTARKDAHVVSYRDDRPAYGGTPSDDSVTAAIADLKARGLAVTFYPFVFMDIAGGNTLPDPYSDNAATAGQPAYPWRGRITVSPASGYAGTADQTAAAATQIDVFFSNGYRRMVLHYAQLCAEAGGVESFLIGSELRGLTRSRSDASTYPAVAALKALAAEVRAILPSAKIGYAADWSEYGPHQTGEGGLCFNLDPLWSDANIDFVGIDNYLPLSDWRDGTAHADAADYGSIYDREYLTANIEGGEYHGWYYASDADRAAQTRTAITDGLEKPWVWRTKDIKSWWNSQHFDRSGGVENAVPTGWVPQSKPIRFTELGCPAIDKGANQPNVFYDSKSSESAWPWFSSGERDDLIQRRFLEAHLNYWNNTANNPVSSVYGGPMLDTGYLALWCWDARPYPYFPALSDVWGDTDNYATGHWLNGRLGDVQLGDLVAALCAEAGFSAFDASALEGTVTGFAVSDTLSVRDALSPLMAAYFFDAVESEGVIRFVPRGCAVPLGIAENTLVFSGDETCGFTLTRAQETDLPNVSRLTYVDAETGEQAVVEARRLVTQSDRVASSSVPVVMSAAEAAGIGERLLQDAWVMREQVRLALPPSLLALGPTDEIQLSANGRDWRLRLTAIEDSESRSVTAVATDPSLYETLPGASRSVAVAQSLSQAGRALAVFLDLPLLCEDQNPYAPFVAAYADPWPGAVEVLRSFTGEAFTADVSVTRAAVIGETLWDFYSGPLWRYDRVNTLAVKLYSGTLSSASDAEVFAGANMLAVETTDGVWEIVQFAEAVLAGTNEWHLTKLRRGRRGTEAAMGNPVPAGARVVLLDNALAQLSLGAAEARLPHTYLYGPSGYALSDPSYQSVTRTFAATALVPFAPCHLRCSRAANGDVTITWRRRDRSLGAASVATLPTPASEAAESYDLEILKDGTAVRTFSSIAARSQIYTAAEIAADFGMLPYPLNVTVYQNSAVLGRGRPKTESLYVR